MMVKATCTADGITTDRRAHVEAAVAVQSSGLLATQPAACASAVCLLEQQQQQQQHSEPHLDSIVMQLATAVIRLVSTFSVVWPSGNTTSSSTSNSSSTWLSSSRQLCHAALPAAHLAVAVLASPSGDKEIHQALDYAVHLCTGLFEEIHRCPNLVAGVTSGAVDSPTPPMQQLLQSAELLRLLAAAHALHTQHLACLPAAAADAHARAV
uniref:Uncharacterized protein n=1 Tax=Tetradesmus obliquus TaxID=3088 RepID=A0A383VAC9_TETOB